MIVLNNKWSLKYKKCKACGTTKHKYAQLGYCTKCWYKHRYKKDKAYYKKKNKEYWQKNKTELSQKNHERYLKQKHAKNSDTGKANVGQPNIQNNQ